MAFEPSNANSTYGHASAHATSIALNSGGAYVATNASGTIPIGVVRAPMPQGKARLVVRSSDAYGSGESLVVFVFWQTSDGASGGSEVAVLDENTVPGAGEYELVEGFELGRIPPGTVVSLTTFYTAGTPNDPSVSLALQLY